MFPKKDELKELIIEQIDTLYQTIDKEDEILDKEENLYQELKEDIQKIVYIPNKDIKKIIDNLELQDKDNLYKELMTIKKIFTMNKDYSSTLRLFKKDKESFQKFLTEYSLYLDRKRKNNKEKISVEAQIKDYLKIIEDLDSSHFHINAKEEKLLIKVIRNKKNKTSEELLVALMQYELDDYQHVLQNSIKKEEILTSEADLIQVFKKHNYDFSSLEDKYKDYFLHHGNLNSIDEIFIALEENKYPKIENHYVLTSILLGSSYKTIHSVTAFSLENHLIPKSLLDISGALLEEKNLPDELDEYSYMMIGSSLDFMRNILTLKNAGISINYIYQECKSILTMPNSLLKTNLDYFYKYGFSFEYKRRGIIDPSPAALLSTNFANICDAFIEIHPLGLKYLTDNLSNLRTVSNPKALMFYNIYASERSTYDLDDDNPNKGPFRKVMEVDNENYQLKAMITRNSPDYRGSYYLGIDEDNKLAATNTIEVDIKERKKYDRIISENHSFPINDSIFKNSYIESINKYIDEDSALLYNFKGVRISRLKVLRIYNTLLKNGISDSLDSFLYAITYNTIISQEDYGSILDCIKKEVEEW